MAININGLNATNDDGYLGNVVLSDVDESGSNAAKNMVVLSQASYDARLTYYSMGNTLDTSGHTRYQTYNSLSSSINAAI
jgi:hypothetical protein